MTTATSSQRSRDDVVAAAGRLFAERGFHGTSMRDLGAEVGLLGSSLYSHITSKHELLVEVVRHGGALFQSLADDVLAMDGSAAEQLERIVRGHVAIVTNNLDTAKTILNEARFLPPDQRAPIVAMRDRYEHAIRQVIDRGQTTGEWTSLLEPAMATIQILSVLNALERWYRPDGPSSPDQIASEILSFVLQGLGAGSS